jgi:hypothetical protein
MSTYSKFHRAICDDVSARRNFYDTKKHVDIHLTDRRRLICRIKRKWYDTQHLYSDCYLEPNVFGGAWLEIFRLMMRSGLPIKWDHDDIKLWDIWISFNITLSQFSTHVQFHNYNKYSILYLLYNNWGRPQKLISIFVFNDWNVQIWYENKHFNFIWKSPPPPSFKLWIELKK